MESKRGGGGYIRIVKIHLVDEVDYIDRMIELIDQQIGEKDAQNIINTLMQDELLTEREARIMLSLVDNQTLASITDYEDQLRAYLLKTTLSELRIN